MSLLLVRLAYGTTALFFIPFYFFIVLFPRTIKKSPFLDKIVSIIGLILFFIASFTNLHVKDITYEQWGVAPVFGIGKIFYFGLIFFLILLILNLLFKKYFNLYKNEKIKIQYVLIGFVVFILLNSIFNIFFPLWHDTLKYYPLGNYSAIFFLAFTAYAIVKRELFDVKIILTSTFVALIAILLLLDALIFTQEFTFQIIKIGILAAFLCFGYFLIRSVLNEIERIKELEHLTLKLEKANARLKGLIEMKEEFLHITSHQLRTPLTAIRGMISMWCAGDFKKMSKKDRNEMMKRIYLSTERLNNITNDMIDAMELEGGSQIEQHNFKQVSLVKIIQDTIETLKTNFDKNNLYVNFKYPKNLPEIQGEENYLSQVFLNLIDNAQKYTSKGGVDINIKKETRFFLI
jgi:signal transduction histidine kinase